MENIAEEARRATPYASASHLHTPNAQASTPAKLWNKTREGIPEDSAGDAVAKVVKKWTDKVSKRMSSE